MPNDTTTETTTDAQRPDQSVGTDVRDNTTSAEEDVRTFTVYTENDDVDLCSCPGCFTSPSETKHDCNLLFGADLEGMVADFGTLTFCSVECARAVSTLGSLQVVDDRAIIYANEPVVLEVYTEYTEPVYTCVAFNTEEAFSKAATHFEEVGSAGRTHHPRLRDDSTTIEINTL